MEIVLKTREELGLKETTSTIESGIAKDLFKGLTGIPTFFRKDKRPSITFVDPITNKSITVCVEKDLVEPVRAGKITKEHLMGFTVLRGDNDGLYFVAPKTLGAFKVDDVEVEQLDAVSYNDLAGY